MNERINILIGSDAKYAPYYGVMLTSLFINNKGLVFDVYALIDDSWTEKERQRFDRLTKDYNAQIKYILADDRLFQSCPVTPGHISRATYYRLSLRSVLPADVHKVLWLDGDIIINGSISNLWNMDVEDVALAAAIETNCMEPTQYDRLGYDRKYGYFNAGVVLYNVDYWREHKVEDKIFEYIQAHRDSLKWMDQDVQNALLFDRYKPMSLSYNFQVYFLYKSYWAEYSDDIRSEILEAKDNPVIIHYSGHIKPWNYLYYGYPYYRQWLKFESMSYWHRRKVFEPKKRWLRYVKNRILGPRYSLRLRNIECIEEAYNL